jgi:dienelactone hydrolase
LAAEPKVVAMFHSSKKPLLQLVAAGVMVGLTVVLAACGRSEQGMSLAKAREGLVSQVSYQDRSEPVPRPPAELFSLVRYTSRVGDLAAYVTPEPAGGGRHPAIIWITGGDCNSIGDVWRTSPDSNDQTARAYRDAGIVMMFPSLRGGNDNPGRHEIFLGEVDDVLAARDYLSKLPYVDPDRIYLGGHSTGGTLALLTAELRNPFRAVFAFGPAASAGNYSEDIVPVDFDKYEKRELAVRTPAAWLDSVQGRVYVIEGEHGNISSLEFMRRHNKNPALTFVAVPDKSHFSVLAPTNRRIAEAIVADGAGKAQFELAAADLGGS